MLKYIIYLAIAALIVWSLVYLVRHVRRQLRGDCSSCSGGCGGNCASCHGSCPRRPPAA